MNRRKEPRQADAPDGLDPDGLDDLLRVVAEALEARERDGAPGIERVCRANPGLAARIRRRIALLHELGLLDMWGSVVFRDDSPQPHRGRAQGEFGA